MYGLCKNFLNLFKKDNSELRLKLFRFDHLTHNLLQHIIVWNIKETY